MTAALDFNVVYDHRIADCHKCELAPQRAKSECLSERPKNWNGLMVVAEAPTANESRLGRPMLGRTGALLDTALKQVGLKREETYVTNAVACAPQAYIKGLHEDYPNAISSCLPRLYTEIDHARPRVVLALGAGALYALTGETIEYEKRIAFHCDHCDGKQTLPFWKCRGCKGQNTLPPGFQGLVGADHECAACRWTPGEPIEPEVRRRKCPVCEGKKTRVEQLSRFSSDHKISFVAGGVFRAEKLNYPGGVRYIIPTYHPAMLLKKTDSKAQKALGGQFLAGAFLEHVRKAKRLLTEEASPPIAWRKIHTAEELEEYLVRFADSKYDTLDIETDAKEPFEVTDIKCLGIRAYNAPETVVCVTTSLTPAHPFVQAIVRYLVSKRCKGFQNGSYDTQVIWRIWGVDVEAWTHDTLIAHTSVAPDEPHDLQHIVFAYTDAEPWKPAKKLGGIEKFETEDELYEYNARDTAYTMDAMIRLEREMVSERCEFVHKLDVVKMHVARGMDRIGLPIDPTQHAYWSQRAYKLSDEALVRLRSVAGAAFNPNSHPQLCWALYDEKGPCKLVPAGYGPPNAKGERAPSTDAASLLKQKGKHAFVDDLLEYRRWKKIVGTYIEGMSIDSDWRLRARWNPIGARTGRWSSSPNLMNWPGPDAQDPDAPNMRSMVVAPPGRLITGADLSQAELRVFAALAGDQDLINLCKNADESDKLNPDKDPHSSVAALAFPDFRQSYTRMKAAEAAGDKDNAKKWQGLCKALREVAKMTIYAMLYAAGAETIWQGIYDKGYNGPPVSVEQVQRVINAFFQRYPACLNYRERTLHLAQRTGYVRDALINRFRVFPLLEVDATIAANYAIQATVASMMDMSIVELHRRLAIEIGPTAHIIAQVHDAIYVEHDEKDAQAVGQLLEDCMSQELQLVDGAPWMTFPATAKSGKSWDLVS